MKHSFISLFIAAFIVGLPMGLALAANPHASGTTGRPNQSCETPGAGGPRAARAITNALRGGAKRSSMQVGHLRQRQFEQAEMELLPSILGNVGQFNQREGGFGILLPDC